MKIGLIPVNVGVDYASKYPYSDNGKMGAARLAGMQKLAQDVLN